MCFRDINQVCIPGQERGRSCICVLGISIKCVYQARRVMCMCFRDINQVCMPGQERGQSYIYVLWISIKCVYQARRVFQGYQSSGILCQESERSCIYVLGISIVYTRPGEGTVMCMCFRDINQVCIPGQERGQSCICVLWISIKCVYQARRGGGHVYVF